MAFPAVIAVLTFLAFLPTFQNGFVEWDDQGNFLLNEAYRGLGWTQLRWMFTAFHMGHYVPLTWVTFGIDYLVWGLDPVGYHLTNLILHAANAVLVFHLAVRLLARANSTLASEWFGLRLAAVAAALFFSLHPLRVESVAWATERRDVLCAFFYLLAILAYLRACDAGAAAARTGRLWYAGAVAAAAAALLSKSMAVSLPVVLLVLDVYPLRRLTLDRRMVAEAEQRRVLAEKIPFIGLSAAAILLAFLAVREADSLTSIGRLGIVERLSIAGFSLAFYLWKTLVPLNLAAVYELPASIRWAAPPFLLSGLVVLTITGLAVALWRRWPALAAVWASYVVILLPVSGLVQTGPQITADRYTYLSCLGWALLAAGGLGVAWLHLRRTRSVPVAASRLVPVMLTVSACMSVLTWRQVEVWHDGETLWTHSLTVAPSALAHVGLGLRLEEKGRVADAIAQYEKALRIKPSYGQGHTALGVALSGQGRWPEAISNFEEAARLMPESAVPNYNLGLALAAQGRTSEAIERYREALRRLPTYVDAHVNLGAALAQEGRLAEAAEHDREALRLQPGFAEVHYNLGLVLARQLRTEEAVEEFREALRLKPSLRDAQINLDRLQAQRGAGAR